MENDMPKVADQGELPDWSRRTILLVDDVAINRTIAAIMLDDTNIRIVAAEDGQQALDKFAASPEKFDLILMDVMMPVMDGLCATREIRKLDCVHAKEIPIIAMTATVSKDEIESCLNAGMNDHVAKPMEAVQFFGVLKKYL